MKCYYPIDSAGNRIGFKTPEACVYDASGTSLTTKLAQINSNKADLSYVQNNIFKGFNIETGSIATNDSSKCKNHCEWCRWGNIMIVWIHSYITLGGFETYAAYNLPNGWKVRGHSSSSLTNEFGSNVGVASVKTAAADSSPGVNECVIFIGAGNAPINNVYVDGCLTILLA